MVGLLKHGLVLALDGNEEPPNLPDPDNLAIAAADTAAGVGTGGDGVFMDLGLVVADDEMPLVKGLPPPGGGSPLVTSLAMAAAVCGVCAVEGWALPPVPSPSLHFLTKLLARLAS